MPIVSVHIEYVSFSTFRQLLPIPEIGSIPFILRIAGGGSALALPASRKRDSIAIPATILILFHLILIENVSNPIFIIRQ
jgi:hypothetical protein